MKIEKKLPLIVESIMNYRGKNKGMKIKKLNETYEDNSEVQAVLPPADANALKQAEEDKKQHIIRVQGAYERPEVKELVKETASPESRVQHIDVKDRKELAKVISELKTQGKKFKVGRNSNIGFRYEVTALPIYGSYGALDVDEGNTEEVNDAEEDKKLAMLTESSKGNGVVKEAMEPKEKEAIQNRIEALRSKLNRISSSGLGENLKECGDMKECKDMKECDAMKECSSPDKSKEPLTEKASDGRSDVQKMVDSIKKVTRWSDDEIYDKLKKLDPIFKEAGLLDENLSENTSVEESPYDQKELMDLVYYNTYTFPPFDKTTDVIERICEENYPDEIEDNIVFTPEELNEIYSTAKHEALSWTEEDLYKAGIFFRGLDDIEEEIEQVFGEPNEHLVSAIESHRSDDDEDIEEGYGNDQKGFTEHPYWCDHDCDKKEELDDDFFSDYYDSDEYDNLMDDNDVPLYEAIGDADKTDSEDEGVDTDEKIEIPDDADEDYSDDAEDIEAFPEDDQYLSVEHLEDEYTPAKKAERLWNEILDKDKLDDFKFQLNIAFGQDGEDDASITKESLDDLLANHEDYVRVAAGLVDLYPDEDLDDEKEKSESEDKEDEEKPAEEDSEKEDDKVEESLQEDTKKLKDGRWANVGKDGKVDSGKFATKKEADAQRKAMFANGLKEDLDEAECKECKDKKLTLSKTLEDQEKELNEHCGECEDCKDKELEERFLAKDLKKGQKFRYRNDICQIVTIDPESKTINARFPNGSIKTIPYIANVVPKPDDAKLEATDKVITMDPITDDMLKENCVREDCECDDEDDSEDAEALAETFMIEKASGKYSDLGGNIQVNSSLDEASKSGMSAEEEKQRLAQKAMNQLQESEDNGDDPDYVPVSDADVDALLGRPTPTNI